MTDHRVEQLLVRTLREHADIEDGPVGLVGAARHRARVIQRRRLAAAAAVVTALTAVALAVPLSAVDRADAPPAHGTSEQTLRTPAALRTTVSLAGLRTGSPPTVGWREGDLFHHSDGHDVELPIGATQVGEAGAATVAVVDAGHPSLRLIGPDGVAGSPVVSDSAVTDGAGRTAYVDHERQELVTLAPDGTRAWSLDLDHDPTQTRPLGFLAADRVLVALPPDGRGRPSYVVAGPSGTRAWRPPMSAQAVGPRGLVAGTTTGSAGGLCLTARRGMLGPVDWVACPAGTTPGGRRYEAVLGVGPDGRSLVAGNRVLPGGGTGRVAVLDLRTGRLQRELVASPGAVIGQAVVESGTTVLLAVWEDGRAGIVRCGVDGSCVAAAEPQPVDRSGWLRAPLAAP